MPKPKREDKDQSARFIKKAHEIEADETDETFEHAFRKVMPEKRPKASSQNSD